MESLQSLKNDVFLTFRYKKCFQHIRICFSFIKKYMDVLKSLSQTTETSQIKKLNGRIIHSSKFFYVLKIVASKT